MLQGHFISMTFKDYTVMRADLISNGTSGSILFDIWVRLRGLTAPLFFTITGVVFVFLLTRPAAESYFKLPRVKKGIKRELDGLFQDGFTIFIGCTLKFEIFLFDFNCFFMQCFLA